MKIRGQPSGIEMVTLEIKFLDTSQTLFSNSQHVFVQLSGCFFLILDYLLSIMACHSL